MAESVEVLKHTTVMIGPTLLAEIDDIAEREARSRSYILRALLREALEARRGREAGS